MPTDILWTGPERAAVTVLLAHGAGGAMDSPWLNDIAGLLGERGIRVGRFEFGYMAARRSGTRRAVPRAELVRDEYLAVVEQVRAAGDSVGALYIGGKSYGGRVASLVADELHDAGEIRGLVCLGYPFHPPGKPQQLRTAHLTGIRTPTLVCQGTRDPFGGPAEVAGYGLSPAVTVTWFDGDHGMIPLKSAGISRPLAAVADAVAAFVAEGP
ncbi:alpha/beta fold hydrolase [soil metagenome]